MHRLTTVLASRDAQRLLQRDGQYASDAPWIHAFGEDDELFAFRACGEAYEFFRSTPAAKMTGFIPDDTFGEDGVTPAT